MDTLGILKAARAKIADPKNWGKGPRPQMNGWPGRGLRTCCAAEAIEEIGARSNLAAYRALKNAAGLEFNDRIIDWNDAPERTHAEVIAAFNLAIATLRL